MRITWNQNTIPERLFQYGGSSPQFLSALHLACGAWGEQKSEWPHGIARDQASANMATIRSYLKPFRPMLIMIFLLLVGFLTYITASEEPDDSVNDFAEFETEGDEDEEEETETQQHGTGDQDDDEEGLIKSVSLFITILEVN